MKFKNNAFTFMAVQTKIKYFKSILSYFTTSFNTFYLCDSKQYASNNTSTPVHFNIRSSLTSKTIYIYI